MVDARRDTKRTEFIILLNTGKIKECLEYIDKYDDFCDASDGHQNMLMSACMYQSEPVAIALIDKKCDLTYQNKNGFTALMYASCYALKNVAMYIIDNMADTTTRKIYNGISEMMYICFDPYVDCVIRMIDRGYDIYYKTDDNETLFTKTVFQQMEQVVKKLIDIDTNFIDEFSALYNNNPPYVKDKFYIKDKFYDNIVKYCHDKYSDYKREIISAMNDTTPTNALYQSFRNTYAVELVDVICDFILLRI